MYATQVPMYGQVPAMMGSAPRVARNVQTLGILWCVYGAYRLVMGFVGMFFLKHFVMGHWGRWGNNMPMGPDFGPHLFGALLPFVGVITVIASALAVATGISLMMRKPWGRTLAIVAGILALLKPILGTALGVYTLWVMAPSRSGVEYDAIADRS